MTMLSPRHQRSLQGRDHPSARAMGHWKPSSFATLEWVDWFNNRRLSEPIGNIPPAEAEERYYAMLEQRTTCHDGVTQTKWPPANPERFSLVDPHGSAEV